VPRGVFDITILGNKEIERAFKRLPEKEAPKVLRKACRASVKRLKPLIAAATPVDTGRLKAGMLRAKVRSAAKKRGEIYIGLQMPTREELNIPANAKGYYPYALEYGSKDGKRPARPFIRPTVNANTEAEQRRIGHDLGKHIEAY
jgi:predicted DNA-binding protein (UPF0278 family)